MEKEKFDKLPKWAQYEITRLTRNLEIAKLELDTINGKGETNVYIVEGLNDRPLPNESLIRFVTKLGRFDVTVNYDTGIDIQAMAKGSRHMAVLPRASNKVFVTFIDD